MDIFLQVFKPGIQIVVISSWKKYQVFDIYFDASINI